MCIIHNESTKKHSWQNQNGIRSKQIIESVNSWVERRRRREWALRDQLESQGTTYLSEEDF
jgi:hypothetical protein